MDVKKTDWRKPDKKTVKYIILAVILLVSLGIYMLNRGIVSEGNLVSVEHRQEPEQTEISAEEERGTVSGEQRQQTAAEPEYIYVDVSGAVNTPMVVCVPSGSRVFEAIDAAGGKSTDASVKHLNLASVCEDGQKIYVPTKAEVEAAEMSGAGFPGLDSGSLSTGESQFSGGTQTSSEDPASSETAASKNKININTAGSEELQTLTGVGPAIASRIIDYRNTNGAFQSTEEIRNVNGIGEKTYEKFKDEICV